MIEVEATVNLPRLGRGQRAIVDETDPAVKKQLRWGGIIPVTPREPDASKEDQA